MANHCYNEITITGKASEIRSIHKWIKENTEEDFIDFTKIRASEQLDKDFDFGTKWFFVLDIEVQNEELIQLNSETAWAPALELFQILSKNHKTLTIDYYYEEMGCDFAGRATIKNGEIDDHSDTYWRYKFKNEYSDTVEQFFEDELSCFDTLEEFKQHEVFNLLKSKDRAEALKRF